MYEDLRDAPLERQTSFHSTKLPHGLITVSILEAIS